MAEKEQRAPEEYDNGGSRREKMKQSRAKVKRKRYTVQEEVLEKDHKPGENFSPEESTTFKRTLVRTVEAEKFRYS